MKSPSRKTTVCVIGAGVCGIASVKACLESEFEVTCFDKSDHYGGLWNYQDSEQVPSVMKTTILNTSKELSAFSDFPPPSKFPNFMKHNLYMDYIKSYVKHFEIEPHLCLKHEILNCNLEFSTDSHEIRWSVDIRDIRNERTFNRKFDKLMIAVGHHNIPYMPTFMHQSKFKGQIIHSAHLKDILADKRFIGKRVVVVGFGNSACDAANDLALITDKCYVSTHRGNWFLSRLCPTGLYDFEEKTKWTCYKSKILSTNWNDRRLISKAVSRTNHQLLGLTPKHKPSEQVPAINDLFPYRVFTGGVILKGSLAWFTENGVVFEGEEREEYEVDIVVLATGYTAKVTFLDEQKLGIRGANGEYELYLNIFAPKLSLDGLILQERAVESLAYIGLVQPAGSITVISELQARLATLVFGNRCQLPGVKDMNRYNQKVMAQRSAAIRSHSRDQLIGGWIDYCDKVAEAFGAKPDLSKLFFKDFALWRRLMFGPSVSYQYRLVGPGCWSKARETILEVDNRVYEGINEGKNHILFKSRRKSLKEKLMNQ